MQKSQKKNRPVMSFLKDETDLIGVIVSSICTVPIALLLDTQGAALIAVFVSTAASCVCFAATFTKAILYRNVRKSRRNPLLAASWLMANSMTFYYVADLPLLFTTWAIGAGLAVLIIGVGYFSSR
jgi:O-antigen/teichoic acid export membrane protein